MQEIVAQDEPITQVVLSAETAMDMCRNRHMEREAELLRHVGLKNVMTYQCGQVFDYYMGPMLPSMGYLTCFNLRSYAPGVILETPKVDNPNELPPYKEIPKMARLFLDAEEWGRIVRCQYVSDLNRYIADETIQDIVDMAEALQEKKLAEIADYIVRQRPKIKVILIAGPSSAGKTTFCKRLTTQLRVVGLGGHEAAFLRPPHGRLQALAKRLVPVRLQRHARRLLMAAVAQQQVVAGLEAFVDVHAGNAAQAAVQ